MCVHFSFSRKKKRKKKKQWNGYLSEFYSVTSAFRVSFFPYGQRLTLKKSEVEDQKSTKGEKKMRQGREKQKKKKKKKQTLTLYRSKMCVCVCVCVWMWICGFRSSYHRVRLSLVLPRFSSFFLFYSTVFIFFFSSFRRPTPQTGKKKKRPTFIDLQRVNAVPQRLGSKREKKKWRHV